MKRPTWLDGHNLVKLAFAIVAGAAIAGWLNARADTRVLASDLVTQRQLTASTAAKLAATSAARDDFRELYHASKELKGDVLAGVLIRIPKRDTTVVHDTLVTVVRDDSVRVAVLHDSTFAGVLSGTITAPPFPAALGFRYTFTRPAFSPSVGFVQVGNRAVAVVTWQGEHYEITDPFWKAPLTAPRLRRMVEVDYDIVHQQPVVAAGLSFRLFWGVTAAATLEQPLGGVAPIGKVGLRREW